jgi:hypothetical protein
MATCSILYLKETASTASGPNVSIQQRSGRRDHPSTCIISTTHAARWPTRRREPGECRSRGTSWSLVWPRSPATSGWRNRKDRELIARIYCRPVPCPSPLTERAGARTPDVSRPLSIEGMAEDDLTRMSPAAKPLSFRRNCFYLSRSRSGRKADVTCFDSCLSPLARVFLPPPSSSNGLASSRRWVHLVRDFALLGQEASLYGELKPASDTFSGVGCRVAQ